MIIKYNAFLNNEYLDTYNRPARFPEHEGEIEMVHYIISDLYGPNYFPAINGKGDRLELRWWDSRGNHRTCDAVIRSRQYPY